jgi:hypothetical protein
MKWLPSAVKRTTGDSFVDSKLVPRVNLFRASAR